jgi:hypothetical protein
VNWLIPALIASFAGYLILFFAYLNLYLQEREKYLALWSASWGLYCIRFIFEISVALWGGQNIVFAANQLTSLWSGVLLLWGTSLFSRKELRGWCLALFGAGSLWIITAISFQFSFMWITIPTFFVMAFANIWTGIVLLQFKEVKGLAKSTAGWSFILWGLHKAEIGRAHV